MKPRIAIFLAAMISFTGCSTIHSVHPIGSPLSGETLENFKSMELDGSWVVTVEKTKKVMHVKYLGDGKLSLASAEWSSDHFELHAAEGLLTELGDHIVLNMREAKSKEDPDPMWDFMLLSPITEDQFVAVLPRVDAFAEAIKGGKISGEVKTGGTMTVRSTSGPATTQPTTIPGGGQGTEVILKDKSEVLAKLITEAGVEHFFTTESPAALLHHVAGDDEH